MRPTFSNQDIARISVAINEQLGRIEKYLLPPVIELQASVAETPRENSFGFGSLFLPGIMMMALLFTAQGLSDDIWLEKFQGTLRRAVSTPASLSAFLAGKVVASAVIVLMGVLIVLVIGMLYSRMPLVRLPLAALWATAVGVEFFLLLLFVQLYAASPRAASILVSSLMFPLLFLGGSFFPFESMPPWMATIGRWTPNGWALEQLKNILFDRYRPVVLGSSFVIISAIALLLFALSQHRLRTFARS